MVVARHPAAAGLPGTSAKHGRPVRVRSDGIRGTWRRNNGIAGRAFRHSVATIIPSLRDGSVFNAIPGNKLPGYDHSVPPGRKFAHSPTRYLRCGSSFFATCAVTSSGVVPFAAG